MPEYIDRDTLWVALWNVCAPNWDEFHHWLRVLVQYRWGTA